MSASFTVKFTLTRSEVVSSIRQSMLGRRALLIVLTILVYMAAYPFISYAFKHSEDAQVVFRKESLLLSGFCLAAIGYLFGVLPLLLSRRMSTALRDQEQVFRFTDKGSEATTGAGEAKFDWKAWVRYRETGRFFFLYPGPNISHVIPKRAFASTEEVIAFRNLLKQKIKR